MCGVQFRNKTQHRLLNDRYYAILCAFLKTFTAVSKVDMKYSILLFSWYLNNSTELWAIMKYPKLLMYFLFWVPVSFLLYETFY